MPLLGLILTLFALVSGALIACQAPINADAAARLGSPLAAAPISFCAGTVALFIVTLLFVRHDVNLAAFKTMPLYVMVGGGLLGAFFVTANTALAPRIGITAIFALGITGQLLAALMLDRFGVFGLVERELTLGRVGGTLMVLAGALMVRYL